MLYQLCAGAPEAMRQRLRLPHPEVAAASFLALSRGECLEIAGVGGPGGKDGQEIIPLTVSRCCSQSTSLKLKLGSGTIARSCRPAGGSWGR